MQTEHIVPSAIKASLRTRSFVPHVVRAAASLYLVSFRMILSAAKPTITHLQCPLLDDSCVMEMTPTQAALNEAATAGRIGKTSQRWCSELRTNGQGEQCTWGFRIYRTVYTPGSDDDFAAGLRIISAHLRKACFRDADKGGNDTPNQQLWQRMKNEIIDDRVTFEGAPPSVIQQHYQAWIEQQGYYLPNFNVDSRDPWLDMAGSASHRFCIIIDADALTNILRFAPSRVPEVSHNDDIGVKVLDVECHAQSEDYEPPFDEGWLWAAPYDLARIWFECAELAPEEMRDTDGLGRPVLLQW